MSLYKKVVEKPFLYWDKEMTKSGRGYCQPLDADSEGLRKGKFLCMERRGAKVNFKGQI